MSVSEEEAAEEEEAEGVPRRDPSEKQEPRTVMWRKIDRNVKLSGKHG